MALEIVTACKNDKLKRMTRNMYTTREHGKRHVSCFVSRLFCTVNKNLKEE